MKSSPLVQAWCQAFEWMSEGVLLVEPDSRTVVFANASAQRLLGFQASGLRGLRAHDVAPTPQDVFFWSEETDLGAAHLTHTQLLHAQGHLVPVEQRIQKISDPHGAEWLLWSLQDLSAQRRNEHELENLLAELRSTLDSAADGLLVCSMDGRIRAFNHKFAEIWAIPSGLLLHSNDAAVFACLCEQQQSQALYEQQLAYLSSQPMLVACHVLELLDRRVIERRAVPLLRQGVAVGRIFSFRDITQETQTQNSLRLAAQVFGSSIDAIFIADTNGVVIQANPACDGIFGSAFPVGSQAADLFAHNDRGWIDELVGAWSTAGYWEGHCALRKADGSHCPVKLTWVVSRDAQGFLCQSIGFVRDLTQQKAAQEKIEQLAFSDALTGLPNRLMLGQHVSAKIERSEHGSSFAILFLDLDRFKIINDSLGHQFGDRVLQLVSQRLQSCLRPHDMLCRLGGDEFVLYLQGCEKAQAELVARRIQNAMRETFELDGLSFSVQCSIGIAQYPEHGDSLNELIKQADTAMYRVKASGKGSYGFYESEMSDGLLGRVQLEHSLRQALSANALHVVYQPQVEIASGRIMGCEALLRWTDAQLGVISPGVFIPLAEESGYIVKLGEWVLEQAIKDAVRWVKQGLGVKVSVNVSSLELHQPDYAAKVAALLSAYGLPACWLELELTESALLQKEPVIVQCIEQLASLGIQLVIDDFGTGYSNLAYLKRMPISKLKVDQSFVRGLPQDASDKAIVEAVVGLGRALDVEIVAEGVETAVQREALKQMGCGYYQGFLCAPGVDSVAFQDMLSVQKTGLQPA